MVFPDRKGPSERRGCFTSCFIKGHYAGTLFLRFVLISSQRPLVPGGSNQPLFSPWAGTRQHHCSLWHFSCHALMFPLCTARCVNTRDAWERWAINNPMSCGCASIDAWTLCSVVCLCIISLCVRELRCTLACSLHTISIHLISSVLSCPLPLFSSSSVSH